MAALKTPFYFCNECKKVLANLDELLFIDEFSHKGFCSEECIEDFYFPLIRYYDIIESTLRARYNLLKEDVARIPVDEDMIEEVFKNPSEVYRLINELNESYYHFIKHYSDYSVIIVTAVYQKEASFVFLSTRTRSLEMVGEFRSGVSVTDWNKDEMDREMESDHDDSLRVETDDPMNFEQSPPVDSDDEDEDMVFMQLLESKKSKILADILTKRLDEDIPFEDYVSYDFCFQDTLDMPDEVFERKDNEGDVLFTYIRSFSSGNKNQETFFYIIICLKRFLSGENEVNVYPLLALPTLDMDLCQEFRSGTRISGPLKN
jgi:hypothetical protein